MVQTDIGELPADLWHLIGETPPGQNDQPNRTEEISYGSRSEPVSKIPQKAVQLQRAIRPTLPTTMSPGSPGKSSSPEIGERKEQLAVQPTQHLRTIQRQEVGSEGETSTPKPVETEKNIKSGTEEVDIETLSNQVYREIKRRMGLELERSRHY